jgi:hypothetical protein
MRPGITARDWRVKRWSREALVLLEPHVSGHAAEGRRHAQCAGPGQPGAQVEVDHVPSRHDVRIELS